MKNSRTLTIAIVLLVAGAALAGIVGMAGAVNGIGTTNVPGVQPFAASGTGAGSGAGTLLATGGPQIGAAGQGAGGSVGTPYATGGPSRCVGSMCTADWVGTGGPLIGSRTGAGGSQQTLPGIPGTGTGIGLNVPAGTGAQGRDYSEWYARCAGVVGPGNDPMCRLGSPASPYTTPGQQSGGLPGAVGSSSTPLAMGGLSTGGPVTNPSTLPATGGPQIGGGQSTGGTLGTPR